MNREKSKNKMTFKESLKKLNIEDYGERIFNSNSHGELMHLMDYPMIASLLSDEEGPSFRQWFEETIAWAEKNWNRPESIFQHILKMMGPQAWTESD